MANLDIKGPGNYAGNISPLISMFAGNPVGQILLKSIWNTGKTLKIRPFEKGHGVIHGSCNAITTADSPVDAAAKGLAYNNDWFVGKSDDPRTITRDERDDRVRTLGAVATGRGSDVTVYYSPESHNKSQCSGGRWFRRRRDSVP